MKVTGIEGTADEALFPGGTVRISYASDVDGYEDWALFRPGAPDRPVVVYLHGSFASGDQLFTRPDIRDHFVPVLLREDLGILAPNLRGTVYMCPAAVADMAALLDTIEERFGVEQGFIFLGGSGGASSAIIFALRHPERVQGLIALGACDLLDRLEFARNSELPVLQDLAREVIAAYGGPPEELPSVYEAHSVLEHGVRLSMPFLLATGEDDQLIPVAKVRLVAHLMRHKPHFVYREIPGGDHDSPLRIPAEEMLGLVMPQGAAQPG
jgi:pimeloyl-ACP methyl ester carboxylesterase